MNNVMRNLKLSLIFGLMLTLPFIVLELIHMQKIGVSFPFVLFGALWLLASVCAFLVIPLVREVRAGHSITAAPASFVLRVTFAALVAIVWTGIVNDQMPCFLGIPNCD